MHHVPSAGQLQSPVPEPWRLAYGWAHDPGRANQILSHHEPEDNTAGLLAAVLLQCGQSLRENEANLEEWGAERGRPVERGCSGPLKDSPPASDVPVVEAHAPLCGVPSLLPGSVLSSSGASRLMSLTTALRGRYLDVSCFRMRRDRD